MSLLRACLVAATLLFLPGCPAGEEAEKPFSHAVLTPEPRRDLPTVALVDGAGKPLPKDYFAGRWTWLYFGFTHCPDVCPRAMEFTAAEYAKLRHKDKVRVVFVSVDPQRDRNAKLERFVDFYHPDFTGVTGDKPALDALAKAVGAAYVIDAPAKPGGDYNVSHTNMVFVVDPEGRWSACYVPEAAPGALAEDFNRLTEKETP